MTRIKTDYPFSSVSSVANFVRQRTAPVFINIHSRRSVRTELWRRGGLFFPGDEFDARFALLSIRTTLHRQISVQVTLHAGPHSLGDRYQLAERARYRGTQTGD